MPGHCPGKAESRRAQDPNGATHERRNPTNRARHKRRYSHEQFVALFGSSRPSGSCAVWQFALAIELGFSARQVDGGVSTSDVAPAGGLPSAHSRRGRRQTPLPRYVRCLRPPRSGVVTRRP